MLEYHTNPVLGTLNPSTYNLIGSVLESDLINQLERRACSTAYPKETVSLTELMPILMDKPLDSLVNDPVYILQKYGQPYIDSWQSLQLASNSLLCEQFVQSSGLIGNRRLITKEMLQDALCYIAPVRSSRFLKINTSTPNPSVKTEDGKRQDLVLLDSIAVREMASHKALVEWWYKYRLYMAPFEASGILAKFKYTLAEPNSRLALRLAINYLLFKGNGEPEDIVLPNPKLYRPTIIASFPSKDDTSSLRNSFESIFCVGVPREIGINRITLFFLGIHTGIIPHQDRWQDYFTPVESLNNSPI